MYDEMLPEDLAVSLFRCRGAVDYKTRFNGVQLCSSGLQEIGFVSFSLCQLDSYEESRRLGSVQRFDFELHAVRPYDQFVTLARACMFRTHFPLLFPRNNSFRNTFCA